MKTILTLLLATFCATSYGQTIKSIGFNSTNGQIVAATNVEWTNAFRFSTNTVAAQVRTNLGLGATWLTNTSATNFCTAIGLGVTNVVQFDGLVAVGYGIEASGLQLSGPEATLSFTHESARADTRAQLGLGLSALTNTSNVRAMRALSGSSNTNHPFSGSVALTNTNVLVFSNGILQAVQ